MPSDINVTGLQMALDLDTSKATAAMNNFAAGTASLEESFTQSAEQVLGTTADLYTNVAENLVDISDYHKLNLDQATQQAEELSRLIELSDELDQYHEDELEFWDNILENIDTLLGNIDDKNKLHKVEKAMVEDENDSLRDTNRLTGEHNGGLKDIKDSLDDIYRAYQRVAAFAVKTDQAAEAFVTTNYRAYGSQQQLAHEVRATTIQYGLLADKATEAAALAGTMSVQRSELERYTKVLAQTTRFTGLAAGALKEHAFRMRQVGVGAEAIEEHYAKLAEGMRKYKLSTEDMSRVMEGTTLTPKEAELYFGEGGALKYEQIRQAIVNIGKEAGVSAESMAAITSQLEQTDALVQLRRFAPAGRITDVEDYTEAFIGLAGHFRNLYSEMEEMRERGDPGWVQMQIRIKAAAEAYGLASEKQAAWLAALDEQQLANLREADSLEALLTMNELYAESSRTLTQTIAQLGSTIWQTIGIALEPMRDALQALNWALRKIGQFLGPLIAKFGDFWESLEEGGGVIGAVAKTVKILFGAFQAVLGVVLILGPALGSLFGAIRGFAAWVGSGLTALAGGIGAISKHLWPAVAVALGFAAALFMAGGGAYLFALALEKVTDILADADKGARMFWEALIGLGVAMIVFAVSVGVAVGIIAALSGAITPLIPVIVVLLGVLGALAVIAVVVGYGMKLFGEGVHQAGLGMHHLGKGMAIVSANWLGITSWFKLAAGLSSVAGAAGRAAPAMLDLTRAMRILGSVNVDELASGMKMLADSLERLSSDSLVKMAKNTLAALWLMDMARPAITSLVSDLQEAGVDLEGVAQIFDSVSSSLERLVGTLDALRQGAHRFETERWLGSLRDMAFAIESISDRIERSVDKFSASIDKLTASLNQLAEAGMNIRGIGARVSSELDSLVTPMEDYSERLEAASERLETAIENKVLPAVEAAERAGERVGEAPEAVTSVEILPPDHEDKNQLRIVALLEQQNSILENLNESIQGIGGEDVARIKDMMEENVATEEVASTVPNLSSDMAGWS